MPDLALSAAHRAVNKPDEALHPVPLLLSTSNWGLSLGGMNVPGFCPVLLLSTKHCDVATAYADFEEMSVGQQYNKWSLVK